MRKLLIFLLITLPVITLLWFGLSRNPNVLPSTLIGKKAPLFAVVGLKGNWSSLDLLKGKPLVINFWSTWCIPCLEEQHILMAAREKYKENGIVFLGVVYQDSRESVIKHIEKYGEAIETFFDMESQMAINYGVGGIPETFFIDSTGIIRSKYSGPITWKIMEESIKNLQ